MLILLPDVQATIGIVQVMLVKNCSMFNVCLYAVSQCEYIPPPGVARWLLLAAPIPPTSLSTLATKHNISVCIQIHTSTYMYVKHLRATLNYWALYNYFYYYYI